MHNLEQQILTMKTSLSETVSSSQVTKLELLGQFQRLSKQYLPQNTYEKDQ